MVSTHQRSSNTRQFSTGQPHVMETLYVLHAVYIYALHAQQSDNQLRSTSTQHQAPALQYTTQQRDIRTSKLSNQQRRLYMLLLHAVCSTQSATQTHVTRRTSSAAPSLQHALIPFVRAKMHSRLKHILSK